MKHILDMYSNGMAKQGRALNVPQGKGDEEVRKAMAWHRET